MKLFLFALISLLPELIIAQPFLVNTASTNYSISERTLFSADKNCRVINCIIDNDKGYSSGFNILILIRIFNYENGPLLKKKPITTISPEEYVKSVVLPKLSTDMYLNVLTLEPANKKPTSKSFDSLIIYNGKTYQSMRGVVVVDFFNIVTIPKLQYFQTTPTLFNLAADTVPIFAWTSDSIPTPNIESNPRGKLFLLKKNATDEYTFFCLPSTCHDCSLSFYNEYVYRKNEGVIAFRSKYVYWHKSNHKGIPSGKYESKEYFYFREP